LQFVICNGEHAGHTAPDKIDPQHCAITKAMQMVAASKMRKAQQHALAGRPYAALMNKVLVSLQKRTDPRFHPLLAVRPLKKELVLIISTDKDSAER